MPKLDKKVRMLLDRISDEDVATVKKSKKLILGNMYLYGYDAKTKKQMEFWDALPLIILLSYKSPYLLGINLHFIPWTYRVQFARQLNLRRSKGGRLKYKDVKAAWNAAKIPAAYSYLAIRKYLVNRIQTNIKMWDGDDNWDPIVKNVLPKMQKKSSSEAIKSVQAEFKKHKKSMNKDKSK